MFLKTLSLVTLIVFSVAHFAVASEVITDVQTVLKGECLESYRTTYQKLPKRKAFAAASDSDGNHVCFWHNGSMNSGARTYDAKKGCEAKRNKKNMLRGCVIIDHDGKIIVKQGKLHEWDAAATAEANVPVVPATVHVSSNLTNEKIDQFLKVMPNSSSALDSLQKRFASDKEINDRMQAAISKGNLFRTLMEVAEDTQELSELTIVVAEAGFISLSNWAYIGDRVTSVFMASEMINAVASFAYESEGFEEGTSVFEFINDESKSAEARNKIQEELIDSCKESCVVPEDLDVVGARIDDIAAAFQGL